MCPVQCLFLSTVGVAPYSLVLRSLRIHPYADGTVECKEDLNASRALFVLEHNIKNKWCPRTVWWRFLRGHLYRDSECRAGRDLSVVGGATHS